MRRHSRTPCSLKCVPGAQASVIDALEPRRLLAFAVSGTTGSDDIEMRAGTGGNNYDFFVNGTFAGSTRDASIVISGLGGDDLLEVGGVLPGDSVELRGGPGNDTYGIGHGSFFGNFVGDMHVTELPGEGTDFLVVNNSTGSLTQAITVSKTSFDGHVSFDNSNVETKQIDFSNSNDNVVVSSVPGNMWLKLGNGTNTVTYGGSSHVLEDAPALGTVEGGSGTDKVVFDDTGADANSHHDYTMTNTRAENQELIGVETLELKVREHFNTGFADNPITMTGIPASLNSITIRDTQGPTGVGADLFIGTEASPIDLDNHSLQMNVIFDHYYSQEIHDQDTNSTGAAWSIYTAGTSEQRVSKGNFNVSFFSPSNNPIWVYGGSTADHFGVGGLLDNSFMVVSGGAGDDTLETNNLNGHDNDLDGVFLSNQLFAGFHFGGGPGNDSLDLNDSADQTGDGDQDYWFEYTGSNFQLRKGDSARIIDFGGVEQLNVVLDADNNTVHALNDFDFDRNYRQHVTIDGGPGNDYFTTFDPEVNSGQIDVNAIDYTIIGGPGIDELYVNDTDTGSLVSEYDIGQSGLTYEAGSHDGSFLFDASLETFSLAQNQRSTTTRLNTKRSSLNLSVSADDGDDMFIVGGGDLDNSGLLTANTTVFGGAGNDSIVFDDRLDAEAFNESENYTFGNSSIAKGGAVFLYSAFEAQTLQTADRINGSIFVGNTVNINAISGFIASTTIEGGSLRDNTVNVTTGNLINLSGVLNLNLNAAGGVVNVNDQNDTGNDNYILTANQLRKTVNGSTQTTINYSGAQFFILNANNDGNNIFVNSTPAGTAFTINADGGADSINLGDGNVAANLLGPVSVNGGGGFSNTMYFNNTLDTTPSSQTLNGLSFTDGQTHTLSGVLSILIENGAGGGTLNLDRVSVFTNVSSASPQQTVNIGAGNLDANLLADCSVSNATTVNIDDRLDTGNDGYVQDQTGYRKTTAGAHLVGASTGIGTINLQANNGNNTIQINFGQNNMRFFGNGGNDQFFVADTQPLFTPETIGVDTGPETPSAIEPLGDYVTVNSDAGTSGDVGAKVRLLADDVIRKLTVNIVGTFQIPTGVVGDVREINLPGGTIDLAGGALLSRAGGTTPATFRTLLTRGRNGGAWNGTNAAGAVNSSLAAASALGDGVGYGLGSQIAISSIGSFSIAPGDTLLRYTLDGDANLDAQVNISDLGVLATHWQGASKVFAQGDFNYDGTVDITDLGALATNWQQHLTSAFAAATSKQTAELKGVGKRTLQDLNLQPSVP